MAKILIIGGGGMVGQKLAHRLAANPLSGDDHVTLFDMVFPENGAPADARVTGNVTDTAQFQALAAQRFDVVFHLVAIVSGQAETDFDLGWNVNMVAFRNFLESFRALREKIAKSDKFLPLLDCSWENMVSAGPIRVDRWNLDECRQVWEWVQNDIPPPQCLLDEVKRIREAE